MTDEPTPSESIPEEFKDPTPTPAPDVSESVPPEPQETEPDPIVESSPESSAEDALDFDFTPSWARKTPGTVSTVREGRGDRGRGDSRGDRRGGQRGGPRGGGSRDQGRRSQNGPSRGGPRSEGGSPAPRSANQPSHGRPSSGPRDTRPRSGGMRPPRPPRLPVRVDFIPDNQRLKKVIHVMKEARRAFSLDELAGKFISNPSFFSVKITVYQPKESKEEPAVLYQMAHTRWVFLDRSACEQHAMEYGLDTQFTTEEVVTDPPAGQFVGVGRCRLGGELVGPPNWHGYVMAIEKLRLEKYDRMSPDDFKRKIELVRDEEVVEAWKTSMSVVLRYRPKEPPKKEEPVKEAVAEPESTKKDESAVVQEELPGEDVTVEEKVIAEVTPEEAPVAEKSVQEEGPVPDETKDPEPVVEEAPQPSLTRAEAEATLKGEWLQAAVKEGARFIMPGSALAYLPLSPLQELLTHVRKREANGHMTLIRALKPALKHMRFLIFQDEGKTYVTGIQPAPLVDREHVIPEMNKVVDHVQAHPGCTGKALLEALCPDCALSEEPAKHYAAALHMLVDRGQLIEFQDARLKLPTL